MRFIFPLHHRLEQMEQEVRIFAPSCISGQKNSIRPSTQIVKILELYHMHHQADSKKDKVKAEGTYTVNHVKLEGTHSIFYSYSPYIKSSQVHGPK